MAITTTGTPTQKTTSAIPVNDLTAAMYAFAQVGNCAPPYATDANPTLCNANTQNKGVQDYKLYSTDPYSDFNVIPSSYKNAGQTGKGNMGKTINRMHTQGKAALLSIGGYSLTVPLATAMNA